MRNLQKLRVLAKVLIDDGLTGECGKMKIRTQGEKILINFTEAKNPISCK